MGMRGVLGPKFVFDNGGMNEATVIIDYWVTTRSEPVTKFIEHESELDSEVDLIKKGTHYFFEGRMNLYKYGLPEPLDVDAIKAKYDEIVQYHGSKVTLWEHRDGEQFKINGGADALFVLTEVIHYALNTPDFKDALILKFRSVNPIDSALGVAPTIQASEIIIEGGASV